MEFIYNVFIIMVIPYVLIGLQIASWIALGWVIVQFIKKRSKKNERK